MKLAAALVLPALILAFPASARNETYRAVGTEPGWTLTIERGWITYAGDYGKTRIRIKAPAARPSFNGRRYVTRRLVVDITRTPCSDGMSDRKFPDRVTVTVGRRSVKGCGGDPMLDTAALDGSHWTIASIDGRPVRTARATELRFEGDRVAGNAGCNSFGGSYRLDRGNLSASRVISTKMACPGPGMAVEGKFLAIIAGPARVAMRDRTLTLSSAKGNATLTRTD
jgi:heat shock protein HslJ